MTRRRTRERVAAGNAPVPLIVGLGAAAELAGQEHEARRAHAGESEETIPDRAWTPSIIGSTGTSPRMQPHVLNVSFPGVDSEALMLALRSEIAISNGSACTSAGYSTSHVLRSMGLSSSQIESAVRISWGPGVEADPRHGPDRSGLEAEVINSARLLRASGAIPAGHVPIESLKSGPWLALSSIYRRSAGSRRDANFSSSCARSGSFRVSSDPRTTTSNPNSKLRGC